MSLKTTTILDGQLSSCIWIKKSLLRLLFKILIACVYHLSWPIWKGKTMVGPSPIRFMSLEMGSTILKMPTLIGSRKMCMIWTEMVQQRIKFHMLNQTIRLLRLKESMHANISLKMMTCQTLRLWHVPSNQVKPLTTNSPLKIIRIRQ